jgi:hypothetical protein
VSPIRQPIGDGLLHLQSQLGNDDPLAFNRWCDQHHGEFLAHVPGALSVRRFEVTQTRFSSPGAVLPLLTLYQLDTPVALDGPEYEHHTAEATPMPAEAGPITGFVRTIYRQLTPADGGSLTGNGPEPASAGQLVGPALLHVFGEVDGDWEDEMNAWYDQDHLVALAGAPGVLSARRFIDRDAPAGPGSTQSPAHFRYLAIYEMEDVSAVDDPGFAAVAGATEWRQKIGSHFRSQLQVYRQVFPQAGAFTG